MIHNSCELYMQMCGKPISRPQLIQKAPRGGAPEIATLDVALEPRLCAQQRFKVTIELDPGWPVVRHHHVDGPARLVQLEGVVSTHVVHGLDVGERVRQTLVVQTQVVARVIDAREAADAKAAEVEDRGGAEVVDVGGGPAAVVAVRGVSGRERGREGRKGGGVQLPQMAAGLVVPTNKDRQVRSTSLAGVVLVEIADCAVLGGTGHDVQVLHVAHGLEVSTDDEEVHAGPFVDFAGPAYGLVDCIKSAVALWGERGGGGQLVGSRGGQQGWSGAAGMERVAGHWQRQRQGDIRSLRQRHGGDGPLRGGVRGDGGMLSAAE